MTTEERSVVQAAEAMFDAWELAKFGSNHHAITAVLVAVGKLRGRVKDDAITTKEAQKQCTRSP